MVSVKEKIEIEAIILLILGAVVGYLVFVVYRSYFRPQFNVSLVTPVAPITRIPAQPAAKIPASEITTVSSQISPDGTKEVIVKTTINLSGTTTYDISTADAGGINTQYIYSKTVDSSTQITIPFNTWSPNDEYFFLNEQTAGSKNVYVFNADGSEFSPGVLFLNVTDAFSAANTGYGFGDATGWASDNLIIIDTLNKDNTEGQSYWFEVPGGQIIPLATQF